MKTEKEGNAGREMKESLAEQNKNLVRRAVEEIWNQGNYDNVGKFVSHDFVVHSDVPDEEIRGHEGVKQFFTQLRKAFPDIYFSIEDQIAEDDKVVTHWTAKGTHKGEFKGIRPTGKQFSVRAIDIDRIINGKVIECWTNMDELSLLQQLGVIAM
jgi:steroid delta-isomerase-like uncharacterized protein